MAEEVATAIDVTLKVRGTRDGIVFTLPAGVGTTELLAELADAIEQRATLLEDAEVVVDTVQNVGSKTFFLRGGRWVDSTLTEEQSKAVQKIERYSKEYFALLDKHGKDAAKYLAIEGEVTLVLGGQAYEF